jgi:hypothetical protein
LAKTNYFHPFDTQEYIFSCNRHYSRSMHHNIILILGPNSVFGLWRPTIAFLTPKSKHFVHLYKIFDRLMGHMTCFFEPPVLHLGGRGRVLINFFYCFGKNSLRIISGKNENRILGPGRISPHIWQICIHFSKIKKI